jgi:hypothetical protein
MRRFTSSSSRPRRLALVLVATMAGMTGIACLADLPDEAVTQEQVVRGRQLVIQSSCGECHNRGNYPAVNNPNHPQWLSGFRPGTLPPFPVGPFKTYPRNLTPDSTTGLGRFTPRQIFNALRYGLRPGETPDVLITSTTPGEGNFPAIPKYLAPPMPWPQFRHKSDAELWDIIAYLKHGVKPVSNKVEDSEGPPNFWAGEYVPEKIGPYPLPVFPAGGEEFKP